VTTGRRRQNLANWRPPIKTLRTPLAALIGCAAIAIGLAGPAAAAAPPATAPPRDGQHDFDFEIGTWQTHLTRLVHPLSGSKTWAEYNGVTVVRKVWEGHANLVELKVDGAAGPIEALSLRLYDPTARQWSLNFSNMRVGALSLPSQVGEFNDGRGEFFAADTLNGRAILARFIISDVTPNSVHFEQAFSDDGGKTWETNWIATDTRMADTTRRGH
jgi:hypothetical protein